MVAPGNGSLPRWADSTNSRKAANSMLYWPRVLDWPTPSLVLSAHAKGQLPVIKTTHIGPALVFDRLWQQTGCQRVIKKLLSRRRFEFDVERAIFLTVLHRLFVSGSDRAADKWKRDYQIEGCDSLQLHHLYRAMAWLGEVLPKDQQTDKTPFAPRCVKDRVEEDLFAHRRDLFTDLQLVFFDTTSIYFEGEGGETLGEHGHTKDHRPDLNQMVVGTVLDGQGRPICCELWPGNTTDVKTLIPVVDRLRSRFGIKRVCIVADRGMISKETIEDLENDKRGWLYILGARMRAQREVRDEVISRGGRYRVVHPEREFSDDPSPLDVKEVWVGGPSVRRLPKPGRGPQGRGGSGGDRGVLARAVALGSQIVGRQSRLPPILEHVWS